MDRTLRTSDCKEAGDGANKEASALTLCLYTHLYNECHEEVLSNFQIMPVQDVYAGEFFRTHQTTALDELFFGIKAASVFCLVSALLSTCSSLPGKFL
jgi:hypothetical protein